MEEESGPDWADTFESAPLVLDGTRMTLEEEAEVHNEMLDDGDEEEALEPPLDLKEQVSEPMRY